MCSGACAKYIDININSKSCVVGLVPNIVKVKIRDITSGKSISLIEASKAQENDFTQTYTLILEWENAQTPNQHTFYLSKHLFLLLHILYKWDDSHIMQRNYSF